MLSQVQLCCNPMDYSPPGSSVYGIFQARILERAAIPFSRVIFLTQLLKPCLLHLLRWQGDSFPLLHIGSLRKTPIQYTNAYIWNLERW